MPSIETTQSSDYYKPENLGDSEEVISPSGKYKLVIQAYKTIEGCWDHTKGLLFCGDQLLASIERNYGSFAYNFVQDGDKEYLISGRSYMGITIIDCETGHEWNYYPEKEDRCQAKWQLCPPNGSSGPKTLMINACFWGGSWEYLFYDFDLSKFDPSSGLPHLPYDMSLMRDPERGVYPNEQGEMKILQGKDIPTNLLGNFTPNLEEWYFVFANPIEYNTKAKTYQDNVRFDSIYWKELASPEMTDIIDDFDKRWTPENKRKNWAGYWKEEEILFSKVDLTKDVVMINTEEAIYQRIGDKIKVLVYREFDGDKQELVEWTRTN